MSQPLAEQLILALGNAPDPMSSMTRIHYVLPEPGRVSLRVYAVSGQQVRELIDDEVRAAGPHAVSWDGRDGRGRSVASGTYFCRLESESGTVADKMVLMR